VGDERFSSRMYMPSMDGEGIMACMWVLLVVVPGFWCMLTCRSRVGGGRQFLLVSAQARMTTTKKKGITGHGETVAVNGSPAARVQSGVTGGARRSGATARLQAGRKHSQSRHGMQRSSVAGAGCTREEAGSAGSTEARDWLHRATVARRSGRSSAARWSGDSKLDGVARCAALRCGMEAGRQGQCCWPPWDARAVAC
jgi:hypothetical protein